MQVFVGTSGWSYSWNKGNSLDWFIEHSGLLSVELNASFYRFPFPNQVRSWARKGADLRWAVKVHRSITHFHRFNEQALEIWDRFREAFSLLDPVISFYLFQVSPSFRDTDAIIAFAEEVSLGGRFALEVRNRNLLGDDAACRNLQEHAILVSVDSPEFRNRIFPGRTIYFRFHGREGWYSYDYSAGELEETAGLLRSAAPDRLFVFFNNNHAMLENAREMKGILGEDRGTDALTKGDKMRERDYNTNEPFL
jgi:uncharacterized protein YecE (DUF72 family)